MKVLVCGGSKFFDRDVVTFLLDEFRKGQGLDLLINGAAPGADTLADDWAKERGVDRVQFPANWKRYNAFAGPRRNQFMLDTIRPDYVIAFPGGKGTADMMRRARKAGIPILDVKL